MPNENPNLGSVMDQIINQTPPVTTPAATPPSLKPGAEATVPKEGQPAQGTTDDKASAKMNMLIRREKAAIQREMSAKTLEAQITAKAEALAAREAKFQELETLKTTNPKKALELLGISYQDLTNIELNDGQVPPELLVKKSEEKIERFLAEQKAKETSQSEAEKLQAQRLEEQATADFKNEINSFLRENGKKYELINFEAQDTLVYDVINTHYERTINPETGLGKIMTIADASDRVEKFLKGKYEKAKELDSVKALWNPAPPAKPKPPEPTRHKSPTLSNAMSATPSKPRTTLISDDERIQKAISYARGLRS